ncbi:MAG: efflux RND transporter periplasmic adaptor subunit [Paracoccaceae bacterium]
MAFWKQLLLTLVVLGAAVAGLAAYVPAVQPWLAMAGLLEPLQRIGLVPVVVEEAGPGNRGGGGPVPVVAAEAVPVALNDVISAIGSARSVRSVVVQAEVEGQITALHVVAGQVVTAGQLIAELDSEAARIALDRAELILADARVTSGRVAQLQARGAATDLQVQDAELALKTAELASREAEFELRRHRIVAPIAGSLGLLPVEAGDRLSDGAEITRIEDRSSLIVDFRVPERVVSRLALGGPVQAVALASPGQVLEGNITALDNRVDEVSRTLQVQAAIGNAEDGLRAGMAFAITLTFEGARVPAVDPLAIQWGSRGAFVWVVREGKALSLPIRILQRNSDAVLIEAELLPGDLVVTDGVQSLRPGAEVSVAPGDGAGLASAGAGKG